VIDKVGLGIVGAGGIGTAYAELLAKSETARPVGFATSIYSFIYIHLHRNLNSGYLRLPWFIDPLSKPAKVSSEVVWHRCRC